MGPVPLSPPSHPWAPPTHPCSRLRPPARPCVTQLSCYSASPLVGGASFFFLLFFPQSVALLLCCGSVTAHGGPSLAAKVTK